MERKLKNGGLEVEEEVGGCEVDLWLEVEVPTEVGEYHHLHILIIK